MTTETILVLLEDDATLGADELIAASGLREDELLELVEFGVLEPAGAPATFTRGAVRVARRAVRLREAFGLNPAGVALAAVYLDRIDALERRLRELECQLLRGT